MKYGLMGVLALVSALSFGSLQPVRAQWDQDWTQGELKTHLRGVAIVLIRSHNRDKLSDFYRALGFRDWASSERIIGLHAGGGEVLEIGHLEEGAPANPPRTSRTQATALAVFGTHELENVLKAAEANGATFIEAWPEEGEAEMYYIGDPDGNVMGFMARGPMFGDEMERGGGN